ncbi:L,D-transpeptidase family protein [Streptomyces sp. NPDC046805]|uniref:L,D-transpeptidase family protein n=1 Tax=Streptomyces sp. NPDC046805 TaxID=3155134 RepID=UPI0033C8C36C
MLIEGVRRAAVAVAACGILWVALCGCGAARGGAAGGAGGDGPTAARPAHAHRAFEPSRIPGVGPRMRQRIPAASGQVVAVYGDGGNAANATVVLYSRRGATWTRTREWAAHNGKRGWTTDHRSGDRRSPVGVFTLTDAGGVLADPGSKLPYTQDGSFAAPRWWAASHWHDFDYVIAIDYNRIKGTPPNDPARPEGEGKGGSIWLHMDHGSGTSGCVSVSRSAMEYLLRVLDPARHPVVVMGDRAELAA